MRGLVGEISGEVIEGDFGPRTNKTINGAHPVYTTLVWQSAFDEPCQACGRVTVWRVMLHSVDQRVRFGHSFVCSTQCLFRLKLEGVL